MRTFEVLKTLEDPFNYTNFSDTN